MRHLLTVVLLFIFAGLRAQQPGLKVLESGKKISIRGLSVVNDQVIWASGSSGSVARSVDGGKSFTWIQVPGYEKNDFRDIEAIDEKKALIMGITSPAVILKTTDGGQSWKKVFEDTTKGAFFDAMDFSFSKGILVGDPIGKNIFLAYTKDAGDHWQKLSPDENGRGIAAKEGEAFFASSGTNVKMLPTGTLPFILASGGKASGLFQGKQRDSLPIMQGKESTGANSLAMYDARQGIVVGGDFMHDQIAKENAVLFTLNQQQKASFKIPETPPHGYRSCVIYLTKDQLLSCGTSGIDLSKDGGNNWSLISTESYHVCQKAKKGNAVFLAGANGRIAKLIFP